MSVIVNASTSTGLGITSDNSGSVEIQSNGTTQLTVSSSGVSVGTLQFNSGYGSSATAYGCRAWVNFNGTGTVAIRASGNVSSITDNGTGDYTVNFTNALPDANYAVIAAAPMGTNGSNMTLLAPSTATRTSSTCRVTQIPTGGGTGGNTDTSDVSVSIFR